MKKLIFVFILLGANFTACAQPPIPFPTVDGRINFSEIVPVDGASKDDLYARTKIWFADTFKSSNDVIQLDDKDNGVIIGRGKIVEKEKKWDFTVKVQVKDQRFKVEFYDIYYTFEQDVSHLSRGVRSVLSAAGTVTHFNLDERFSNATPACSPGKDCRMYDKDGNLKEGFPTNLVTWTNSNFASMLESIKEKLSKRAVVDDF